MDHHFSKCALLCASHSWLVWALARDRSHCHNALRGGRGFLSWCCAKAAANATHDRAHPPAEDDIEDTIVPRLISAGADLDHIEIVKMVRENRRDRMFSLISDLDLLRQKIIEVGNVKMVQIDPITAYLGAKKMDSFRTTDVRAVLGPVVELAAELKIALVGIMHFNKKVDVNNALLRISDSLAFGATARHVYAVVDDAENDRKLPVKGKNNLATNKNKALAFRFGGREVGVDPETGQPIFAPHVLWEKDPVDVTASEAMQAATKSLE